MLGDPSASILASSLVSQWRLEEGTRDVQNLNGEPFPSPKLNDVNRENNFIYFWLTNILKNIEMKMDKLLYWEY